MVQRKKHTAGAISLEGLVCECERFTVAKFNLSKFSKYSSRLSFLKMHGIVFLLQPCSLLCMPMFCQNVTELLTLSQDTSKIHKNTSILPLCRIFSPCHWQVCEEQTGRMVSTHYLTVIGTWCENCGEVSSLEVCIFIDLSHTF